MSDHTLLEQIENRLGYIVDRMQEAVDLILVRPVRQTIGLPDLTPYDIERHTEHWRFLVPEATDARAELIHDFAAKYAIHPATFPETAAVLGVEDEAVQASYKQQFDSSIPIAAKPPAAPDGESEAIDDLLHALDWRPLARGERLFEQDATNKGGLFCLVDGRMIETVTAKDGTTTKLDLLPGEILGIESLLGEQVSHTGTITAVRHCDLAYLSREQFTALIKKYPIAMLRVVYQLVERLRQVTGVRYSLPPCQSVVILPASEGTADFAPRLAEILAKSSRTRHLAPDALGDDVPQAMQKNLEASVNDYVFADWLLEQEQENEVLLFEANPAYPKWSRRAVEQADHILIVGRVNEAPDTAFADDVFSHITHPDMIAPIDLALLHDTRTNGNFNTMRWLQAFGSPRHHHVALDESRGFERVVRFLRGEAVGLVFGGGGMRGAAHMGVIQALNEAGVDADVVGGTSAGSIVAAQLACGWSVDEMMTRTREQLMQRDVLVNPTLPLVSVNTGFKFVDVLRDFFGDATMEDQWTTGFTLSANLTLTQQSANFYGPVMKAVRYSTSIAGMFPPAPDANGHLHIDGGVYNNTPADVMRDYIGAGWVLASDLGYTQREPTTYDYGDALNGFQVLWRRVNPLTEPIKVMSIFDTLMQSNALAARAATAAQVAPASLVIRPDVAGVGLFDFEAADDLFKAGYEATKAALTEFSFERT